jgi:hypothetical protein
LKNRGRIDYAAKQARDDALGRAGEKFVAEFERQRLTRAGRPDLAKGVDHIADRNDGLGYDVQSFHPDGSPLYIEVKTTSMGERASFYLSAPELAFAEQCSHAYALYRVHSWGTKPRVFALDAERVLSLPREPVLFRMAL